MERFVHHPLGRAYVVDVTADPLPQCPLLTFADIAGPQVV
jgi:hypothetical protein